MPDTQILKQRQPWWLRHAARLVALGGTAIVLVFCVNVWSRLIGAYDSATERAYESLNALAHASTMALTPVLDAAQFGLGVSFSAPAEPRALQGDEPSYRLVTRDTLAGELASYGKPAPAPGKTSTYLLGGAGAPNNALVFAKPVAADSSQYLTVRLPEAWLTQRMAQLLGTRLSAMQLFDADGAEVGWAGARSLDVNRQVVLQGTSLVESGVARSPSFAAQRERLLVGRFLPLPGGWGAVRVASAEGDLLDQYYGRWKASLWLVPVVALLVLGIVSVAGTALRRLQRSESELHRRATTDALTGLPNRATFTALLEYETYRAKSTGRPLGLLFIDLDNFKYVNDSLGHDGGDALLTTIAQRLRAGVREKDTVCRLGGDEFVIVLSDMVTSEDASLAATRVLQGLTRPVEVKGTTMVPQASVGVAVLGEDAENSDELTRAADMAVYEAKASGKSCAVRFTPQLARATAQIAQVVQDLQLGIDRGELFVEFQPKYLLKTGALTGFEALVRWQHPTKGLIMPGQFIEIAETAGLIGKVGNCVMEQVVAQVRSWYNAGLGWQVVAMNVSAVQLRDKSAVKLLRRLLDQYEVPGTCIQVELTESSLVDDVDNAIAAIEDFKAMGATLAVDDFGTGYSSLQSLQRFKVDFLKVDRSFVQGALREAGSLEICRAIVNLGHSLGMHIIAEGIETVEQRDCMQGLGCEQGQGYLLDRPLSAEAATLRLTRKAHQALRALPSSVELWTDQRQAA